MGRRSACTEVGHVRETEIRQPRRPARTLCHSPPMGVLVTPAHPPQSVFSGGRLLHMQCLGPTFPHLTLGLSGTCRFDAPTVLLNPTEGGWYLTYFNSLPPT